MFPTDAERNSTGTGARMRHKGLPYLAGMERSCVGSRVRKG